MAEHLWTGRGPGEDLGQPARGLGEDALSLLVAHKAHGADKLPSSVPLAKWRRRKRTRRATTGPLINQLRVKRWSRRLRPKKFIARLLPLRPAPEIG